jgi:hypothetical protein
MKTDTLLLNRAIGTGSREQCVAWAVDQMVAGADTPSLRILAGLNPQVDLDEVEEFFQKAAREMGIQDAMPSRDLRRAADIIWRCYSGGELTEDRVIDLMAMLYEKSEYQEFRIWYDIQEELAMLGSGYEGCFYPPSALKDLKVLVQREWKLFQIAATINLPKDFMHFIRCKQCGHIGKARFTSRGLTNRVRSVLPWIKPRPPLWPRCSACGSYDYRSMSDPDVREEFIKMQEANQASEVKARKLTEPQGGRSTIYRVPDLHHLQLC